MPLDYFYCQDQYCPVHREILSSMGLCSINFTTTRISPRKASFPEIPAHTDRSEYADCFPGANPPMLKSDMKVRGTLATNLMAVRLPLNPSFPQPTSVILPPLERGFSISVVMGGCVAFEIGLADDVLPGDFLVEVTNNILVEWRLSAAAFIGLLLVASVSVSAQSTLKPEATSANKIDHVEPKNVIKVPTHKIRSGYKHVWPDIKFGWKIVVSSIIGFFGAACGSVGGVGGGGIFVPMLNLIIGFDPKSSVALSKCMITGTAVATVVYNLRQRHPTLDMPVIDYDLALLFQPMLVLGISIGVAFNVIFADWMITVLLIILFIGMSAKAFLKGVETWKKETITKVVKFRAQRLNSLDSFMLIESNFLLCLALLVLILQEAAKRLELDRNGDQAEEFKCEPENLSNTTPKETKEPVKSEVSILKNIYWKELGLLVAVWVIVLALQIAKNYTATCSVLYWVLNFLQIPVAGGVSAYEAVALYKGRRTIASKGDVGTNWRPHQLVFYCACGITAGVVGGLLGLGGGFILGPLFLELGIPPQVSSATATFAMTFSASMSVVEYYLLKRFPVPYALYFFGVSTVAAFVGQHVVRKLINILGRASIIIFTLSLTIFVSALSLGGIGLAKMVQRIDRKEYMGFDSICSYT
ncbi:Sulfite exporter TauE/SafE family protein 3 [Citrus sinensis]|nr:Sulfite exporter TauE/SafE family protein 3 [Citrus sinensis]